MDERGNYQELPEGGKFTAHEGFADELIRFSPKQVTLKAGESQTVKVMLRKPEGLPDGEYRSHLLFQTVPDASFGTDVEAQPKTAGGISVQLIPLIGVSIPLIVRHGDVQASAKMSHASLKGNQVQLTLERSGNKSLFGDLIVTQGNAVLTQMRGLAVYTPNTQRLVTLELSNALRKEPIRISYQAREEDGGQTLAEATLNP